MKKQLLTKQDIQRDLFTELNKIKLPIIFFTAFLCISVLAYAYLVGLAVKGLALPEGTKHGQFGLEARLVIFSPLILFFAGVLFHVYYGKLLKIKNGKFYITKEQLSQKKKEQKLSYRRVALENTLYFGACSVAVDDKLYAYSNTGESFYLVFLKFSKKPFVVYPTKRYMINDPS